MDRTLLSDVQVQSAQSSTSALLVRITEQLLLKHGVGGTNFAFVIIPLVHLRVTGPLRSRLSDGAVVDLRHVDPAMLTGLFRSIVVGLHMGWRLSSSLVRHGNAVGECG